ncbi:MAG: hypothetical protein ABGY29_09665, partial [bacterium]
MNPALDSVWLARYVHLPDQDRRARLRALARALALALQEASCEVLLWARDSSVLGSGACASLGDVAGADLALMAISDSGIDDLAGQLV